MEELHAASRGVISGMAIAVSLRMVCRVAFAIVVVIVLTALSAVCADPVRPPSPIDVVRRHIDEMVNIATDPALSPATRREAARLVMARTFDFAELSRRALGEHWARLTAAQREQVTAALRERLTAAYASPIAHSLGGGVEQRGFIARIQRLRARVNYLGESISGSLASVTMSLTQAGQDLPLQVALIQRGRDWRIVDLTVDGVPLSDNLRAQVDHLSRGARYGELLDRLNTRERSAMAASSLSR